MDRLYLSDTGHQRGRFVLHTMVQSQDSNLKRNQSRNANCHQSQSVSSVPSVFGCLSDIYTTCCLTGDVRMEEDGLKDTQTANHECTRSSGQTRDDSINKYFNELGSDWVHWKEQLFLPLVFVCLYARNQISPFAQLIGSHTANMFYSGKLWRLYTHWRTRQQEPEQLFFLFLFFFLVYFSASSNLHIQDMTKAWTSHFRVNNLKHKSGFARWGSVCPSHYNID